MAGKFLLLNKQESCQEAVSYTHLTLFFINNDHTLSSRGYETVLSFFQFPCIFVNHTITNFFFTVYLSLIHILGQKYKSVPTGFSVDENGRVTDTFETMYMYSDEAFYGFGEKFTDFNKRGQKICVWQRDAQSTNSDISYKGMPYFVSTQGYSILVNTFTRTHFNMGASSGVSYTMETEDQMCIRDRVTRDIWVDVTELRIRLRLQKSHKICILVKPRQ